MEFVIGIDAVIAGVAGVIAGALPSLLRAVWRECVQRRKQKYRLAVLEMNKQSEMVIRGMNLGYSMTSDRTRLIHKDTQDKAG